MNQGQVRLLLLCAGEDEWGMNMFEYPFKCENVSNTSVLIFSLAWPVWMHPAVSKKAQQLKMFDLLEVISVKALVALVFMLDFWIAECNFIGHIGLILYSVTVIVYF